MSVLSALRKGDPLRFLRWLRSRVDRSKAGAAETRRLTIDLVTENPATGAFSLILVEVGPWRADAHEDQLRRIQARLYDCVDAAVDGHVAAKYPDSRGRALIIRLDTYDLPEEEVGPFYARFSAHIRESAEIQQAIVEHGHVASLAFEHSAGTIEGGLRS